MHFLIKNYISGPSYPTIFGPAESTEGVTSSNKSLADEEITRETGGIRASTRRGSRVVRSSFRLAEPVTHAVETTTVAVKCLTPDGHVCPHRPSKFASA